MKLFVTLLIALISLNEINAGSNHFGGRFAFPETRRGRATPTAVPKDIEEPNQNIDLVENVQQDDSFIDKVFKDEQFILNAIQSISDSLLSPNQQPASPRKVDDNMNHFGVNMNLAQDRAEFRQDSGSFLNLLDPNITVDASDDSVRCIPKVMQVEEIVYDRAIKCTHSYQEKCHLTYITDYQSTAEEKCETTFKKNCHITFKPMPFDETVNVCNTPLIQQCNNETTVGPDICSTQYETNCETRYNSYDIEQDEPVCKMELMKKCKNVTVSIPRNKRQAELTTLAPEEATVSEDVTDSPTDNGEEQLTFDQQCEEWPVQKCTLQKQVVKKVHPDTSCRNVPKEICTPNNCQMVPGEEVCYDDVRVQVQNVPQEECDIQPEETCHMESVLVPRLVPQPNCVKVPKEICVNTKANPRRVKKPVVKEWCYKPSELAAAGGV